MKRSRSIRRFNRSRQRLKPNLIESNGRNQKLLEMWRHGPSSNVVDICMQQGHPRRRLRCHIASSLIFEPLDEVPQRPHGFTIVSIVPHLSRYRYRLSHRYPTRKALCIVFLEILSYFSLLIRFEQFVFLFLPKGRRKCRKSLRCGKRSQKREGRRGRKGGTHHLWASVKVA